MALDWDDLVLAPVMGVFGQGQRSDQSSLPFYTPRGLAAFRLADAVFDAEYQVVDVNPDGTPSTSFRPVLGVRLALFPRAPAQNDKVFIPANGKTYVVKEPQADGHGHVKLMLMETSA